VTYEAGTTTGVDQYGGTTIVEGTLAVVITEFGTEITAPVGTDDGTSCDYTTTTDGWLEITMTLVDGKDVTYDAGTRTGDVHLVGNTIVDGMWIVEITELGTVIITLEETEFGTSVY